MKKFFLFVGLFFLISLAQAQWAPRKNNKSFIPDDWLLSNGQPYHFRGAASQYPRNLQNREPNDLEIISIQKILTIFNNEESKALILGDGNNIVATRFVRPASETSLLLSASIDKSLTAFSAGIAICDGRIKLSTKASDLIPELNNLNIGNATLLDLLKMTASSVSADDAASSFTLQEFKDASSGLISYMDLMKGRWASSRLFVKNGTSFDYKSQDPILVSMMIAAAYKTEFRKWQDEYFFKKINLENYRVQGTDKFGYATADSNTRLTLKDWARVASFIVEARETNDCYGTFLKDATTSKIANNKRFIKEYQSYGYFVWTDPTSIPGAYAALGYGGQAIIWDSKSKKYLITFGNTISFDKSLEMARLWFDGK
jgi:CubicO group peptidase (beta-lactamase class C family)